MKTMVIIDFITLIFLGGTSENLKVLKRFENFIVADFFTEKELKKKPSFRDYFNSKLIIIELEKIRINSHLGWFAFFIIIEKLKESILEFVKLIESTFIKYNNKGHIRYDKYNKTYYFKDYIYNENISDFERINDFKLVFNLFANTDIDVIYTKNREIIINIGKIEKYLVDLEKYNFEKFNK